MTTDVDVTPERSKGNLTRLAAALRALGGAIRVDDLEEGLPCDTSAEALTGMKTLNLRTPTATSISPSNPTERTATPT